MHYSLACLSDIGAVRNQNEDNYFFFGEVMPAEHQTSPVLLEVTPAECSFVVGVFDGMGGEVGGETASYAAARALKHGIEQDQLSCSDIRRLFTAMEDGVCRERDLKRARTMGTTATILAVENDHAYVANVGDSPAMLFENGVLRILSREHTDAETLRLLGITGRKPGLTQFLGMSDGEISPSPHIVDFDIHPGNTLLLASDGLTGPLDNDAICSVLALDDGAAEKAKLLRDLAIKVDGTDNITVLLCEAVDTELADKDVVK